MLTLISSPRHAPNLALVNTLTPDPVKSEVPIEALVSVGALSSAGICPFQRSGFHGREMANDGGGPKRPLKAKRFYAREII